MIVWENNAIDNGFWFYLVNTKQLTSLTLERIDHITTRVTNSGNTHSLRQAFTVLPELSINVGVEAWRSYMSTRAVGVPASWRKKDTCNMKSAWREMSFNKILILSTTSSSPGVVLGYNDRRLPAPTVVVVYLSVAWST